MKYYLTLKSIIILFSILILNNSSAEESKIISDSPANGDWFGYSVDIDNDIAVCGANKAAFGDGEIYIFMRNSTTGDWELQTTFSGPPSSEANFGSSIAIDGDNVVVGAENIDNGRGRVYVFNYDGFDWSPVDTLVSSDIADQDRFGYSVDISGNYIIVGAYRDDDDGTDSGSAYVFFYDGANWSQQAKITASDGAAEDYFGYSVAIDGDYSIVGAYGDDDLAAESGAGYVFLRNGTNWNEQDKIQTNVPGVPSNFGRSVSISGDKIAVGAPRELELINFDFVGATYIFTRNLTTWNLEDKLFAVDKEDGDAFGQAVSLKNDYLLVGAPFEDQAGFNAGAVYSFLFGGSTWSQRSKIVSSDAGASDEFGFDVAVDDVFSIVGARLNDYSTFTDPGAAYIYETINDLSLPVELAAFNVAYIYNIVHVEWITESEVDNVGFEIYRSEMDSENYKLISSYLFNESLKGHLNSNTRHFYNFTDVDIKRGNVYSYILSDIDINGKRHNHGPLKVEVPFIISEFEFLPAYPNPFNPVTNFKFMVPLWETGDSKVNLTIYSILGEKVVTLFDGTLQSGEYDFKWNGKNELGNKVSAGIYLAVIKLNSNIYTQKIILTN